MRTVAWAMMFAVASGGLAGATDVHVGINIGLPPPPAVVLPAPPRLVVVPTTPAVRYAPDLSVNFFLYGGQYYTFHEGAWFVASAYDGPWVYVERVHVPHAVMVVPARYYRIPPGHMKRVYVGDRYDKHHKHHSHGHGHGHGHDHDDDD